MELTLPPSICPSPISIPSSSWRMTAEPPPGKIVLTRGLRQLLDYLAMKAILAQEERQHGGLPPRIAAMLGRTPTH